MSAHSKPPPVGTPPPSPPPGGPTHPTPTGPPSPPHVAALADIDSGLISLLAVAYFGPAEQGTARSVDQVAAAEVLLFRLRSARRAVRELADALGVPMTPARRYLNGPGTAGGPVLPPDGSAGEELTPSSAVAIGGAARESTGAVVAPGAGASFQVGSAACGFTTPQPRPLTFEPGEHRLIGLVRRT